MGFWGRRTSYAGVLVSMVAALVVAPPAQAAPGDPNELWVNVSSESTWGPLQGATVTLYDDSGAELDTAATDPFGEASFTGLAAGTYLVSAGAAGHVEEFYDDSPDLAGALPLTVTDEYGEQAWMSLAAEPQVTGTVTGPGGTPLEGAQVTVHQYDAELEYWDWVDSASTGADGAYSLGGLADGAYRLGFTATGHVEEFYDDAPDVTTADDVVVAAGAAPVVADAQLAETTQVSGTVTDGTGPLPDVSVVAEELVEDGSDSWWDEVAFGYTGPDGTYVLDVAPGEYRIRFDSGSHLREWWNDAHEESEADLVAVTDADVTGIDAFLDEGGAIAGTVTSSGGSGASGVQVTAYRWSAEYDGWDGVGSTTTAADGTYTLGNLNPGTYRVGFEDYSGVLLGEYFPDAATVEAADDVLLVLGGTARVDAALDRAPVIEGTVTGPGVTQENLEVSLWRPDRNAPSGWRETFDWPAKTGTTFRFSGLEPGTYRVRAAAPGLAPEFWADAYEVAHGTDVVAERNQTETVAMTLAAAPRIAGTVAGSGGVLPGARAEVERKNSGPDGAFWEGYAFGTADAAGGYSVPVAPGTYRVRFSAADHVAEWHDGSATPSRSTRLAVAGSDLDVDATLARLGRISGTVSGPGGALDGATVEVWRFSTGQVGDWVRLRTTDTDASGGYTVTGLNPGNYRVGFRAEGLQREFGVDAADVERATDVEVALDQTRTVDAVLEPPVRQLSGTVTDEAGTTPLPGVDVTVSRRVLRLDDIVSWHEVATVQTDATGAWSAPVRDGDHRVHFTDGGFVDEYYDDAPMAAQAAVVTVAGADRTGLDARLARGGTITGLVTDATTGQPIPYAEVYAFMPDDGGEDEFAFAGADGRFTLMGVTPGDWVVQYEADDYLTEYYDDQPTQQAADRVSVTAGATVAADAALTAVTVTAVSGTVTGADGQPLDDVWVEIHRVLDGGEVEHYYESAHSSPAGTWSAELPPGTYLVEFDPSGGELLGEWYDDAADEAGATPVVVATTAVTGVDAQLVRGGVVAGTVTRPGGSPEPDARVSVLRAGAEDEWSTAWSGWTGQDGTYRSDGLPAGSYKVRFEGSDDNLVPEYHLDQATLAAATPVAVALGGVTTVDAQLSAYPWRISGTVTDAQGRGLDQVYVGLYEQQGTEWSWVRSDQSDADGRYALPVANGTYRVSFAEYDNRLTEWWNGARTLADATSITVSGANRAGVDAQLEDAGSVAGTVTYPAHVTGWTSSVILRRADTGALAGQATVGSHQNRYAIEDLPAGSYRVEFARAAGFDTAEAEFWNDRPEHTGAGTQVVQVTHGGTATADAGLVEGGTLAGQVRTGAGAPLAGCTVTAYTPNDVLVLRTSRPTRADGAYRVRGLTTGSYRLRVSGGDCGFVPQYYDGAGQVGGDPASAVNVAATRGAQVAAPALVLPSSGALTSTAPPTIDDTTPEVGQTLTASPGSWSASGATFQYQWRADGAPIAGATAQTYTAASAVAGKRLSVRVTASKADFTDGQATSAETAPVVSVDPPLTNTVPPTVSDTTPRVGQELTAGNGTWSQTGATFAYQWVADGADVPGATSRAFTVPVDLLGQVLQVRVTASKAGFTSGSATSAATDPVAKGVIASMAPPTLSDTTPALGEALTATGGTWSVPDVALGYEWLRGGVVIAGASGSSYTPVAEDVGQALQVRVTAARDGYDDASAESAPTAPVVDPSLVVTNTGLPTVSDTTPQVGQKLTAGPGTWSETDATYAYQWYRGTTAISGATSRTYTAVPADRGAPLQVQVTAAKPGFTSGVARSARTSQVALGVIRAPRPEITGTARVGKVLKAVIGTSTPARVTVRYQWLRNGKAIRGATKASYRLVKADKGRKVSVRVTRTKTGYRKLVQTSAAKLVR